MYSDTYCDFEILNIFGPSVKAVMKNVHTAYDKARKTEKKKKVVSIRIALIEGKAAFPVRRNLP